MCVCVRTRCSWWCQVVPNTVASWQAVHQWSDWSKTTREEQAELPAAIRLPVSDGRGHAAPIRSARSCSTVGKSQRVFGDLVSLVTSRRVEGPRLRYERVNITQLCCFFYVFRGNIWSAGMWGKKNHVALMSWSAGKKSGSSASTAARDRSLWPFVSCCFFVTGPSTQQIPAKTVINNLLMVWSTCAPHTNALLTSRFTLDSSADCNQFVAL